MTVPEVPLSSDDCLASIDTLVLAGGLGTRLRPVLTDIPKLLAPISGRPFLCYLLDWLCRFGARRVVLALGHQADIVVQHLQAKPARAPILESIIEPEPLGTAGAIRFARPHLRTDPALIVNGATLTDADICGLVRMHHRAGAAATLLCAEVDDAARYGRVVVDRNGYIAQFAEKDASHHGPALINAGSCIMSAAFLDSIAAGTAFSLERDIFARLAPKSLAAWPGKFNFIDIGTPDSFASAAAAFRSFGLASHS